MGQPAPGLTHAVDGPGRQVGTADLTYGMRVVAAVCGSAAERVGEPKSLRGFRARYPCGAGNAYASR